RLCPLLACGKQLYPGRPQQGLHLLMRVWRELNLTEPIQHVLALKIAALHHPIVPAELLSPFGPQHCSNLSRFPKEVASLMPITVGILCRKECAVRMCEFTTNVRQGLFHH